jgi:hypothetical protein
MFHCSYSLCRGENLLLHRSPPLENATQLRVVLAVIRLIEYADGKSHYENQHYQR